MGEENDHLLWNQFEQLNGVSKCKHCWAEFKGNTSKARLRYHLLQVKNKGIRICTRVPDNVKEALADGSSRSRIELGSSNNNVTNSISIFAPQQNDASVNPMPHRFDLDVAYDSNNIPQFSAQNPAQIGESIRDLVVQGTENYNVAAVHNSVDMIGCNTSEGLGALNQTEANSSSNDGSNKRRRIELGSSSNDVANSISTFAPQQNDASVNPVPEEDSTFGEREDIMELDKCREEQDTRVPTLVDNAVAKCSNNQPQNDASVNPVPEEDSTFGEREDIMELDKCHEEQDTRVPTHVDDAVAKCSNNRPQLEFSRNNNEGSIFPELRDILQAELVPEVLEDINIQLCSSAKHGGAYRSNNITQFEPSSSNNEVPQQKKGFENPVQIEESNQDPTVQVVQCDNLDGDHNREDMIGCNTVAKHGALNQTKADSLLKEIDKIQRKPDESRLCLTGNETMDGNVPWTNSDFAFKNQIQGEETIEKEVQLTNEDLFKGIQQMTDEMSYEELLPITDLVGQGFKRNMDTVWELLMRDGISSIGIHGMGGVGKTTLVIHIQNRILKNPCIFDNVYRVTVSQDFSIKRLQNLIAKTIGLNFENEDDVFKRAAKLLKKLRSKCKFVLILDDLWDHFDVKKVGIPIGLDGCKLIITTRSLKVCTRTNCQEKVKVEPLSKNEAWKLFSEVLGHDLAPDIEQIARSIARECDGLPLGIVTMAGSMREVDDIHEWNNALTDLQNAEVRKDDMEREVFRILRYSYTRLNDPKLQQCLLYCALYPEDFNIFRDDLIEHLVVERIIERTNSRKASYERGQTMLNKLVNVCLLEHPNGMVNCVKMHDLVRDMAIQIMGECLPSLVQAGKQLKSLPQDKCWMDDTVRVTLMNNAIMEIPRNCSPKCPKLSTLLLCNNKSLKSIPNSFFHQLDGLKVLNLSDTMIKNLPESVSVLKNLTALFFRRCSNLRYVPSLSKLGALEVLDLYKCENFEEVPEGLESLSNLNYLNLLFSGVRKLPSGILRKLSHLQFLAFQYSSETGGVRGDEVGCLSNLETLHLSFNDQGDFNNYIQSLLSMHTESQQLSKYILLLVGSTQINKELHSPMLYNREYGQHLYFTGCTIIREVLLPEHIQKLGISNVSIADGRGLCLKNAIHLKEFVIEESEEIEYLFCLNSSPSIFQSLETLYVTYLKKLRGLFGREGDNGVIPMQLLPNGTFSCLKKFIFYECHNMKKLFPFGLLSNLRNLEELEVYYCLEMEEIIASEEEEEGRSNTLFSLPNLRHFELWNLKKLKSICSAKLQCDSLQSVRLFKCPELKKIPISLPLASLEKIIACPAEWWESVEWGHSNDKFDLQPKVSFRE